MFQLILPKYQVMEIWKEVQRKVNVATNNNVRSHRDPSTTVNNVGSIRRVSAAATVGKMMMENHTSLVNHVIANKRDYWRYFYYSTFTYDH
jgi:hypothetical protein